MVNFRKTLILGTACAVLTLSSVAFAQSAEEGAAAPAGMEQPVAGEAMAQPAAHASHHKAKHSAKHKKAHHKKHKKAHHKKHKKMHKAH